MKKNYQKPAINLNPGTDAINRAYLAKEARKRAGLPSTWEACILAWANHEIARLAPQLGSQMPTPSDVKQLKHKPPPPKMTSRIIPSNRPQVD